MDARALDQRHRQPVASASSCPSRGRGTRGRSTASENQLTPWSNDPVSDPPGEAILRARRGDGEIWGPTAAARSATTWPYVARHGQGYSRFEHEAAASRSTLTQFVPLEDPVKISLLTVENRSGAAAHALGHRATRSGCSARQRGAAAPFVVTEMDPQTGALLARNAWNEQFGRPRRIRRPRRPADRVDRRTGREFLGRNGTLDAPGRASPATGHALGPRGRGPRSRAPRSRRRCALAPGRAREVVFFLLGQGRRREPTRGDSSSRYRTEDLEACLASVAQRCWDDTLAPCRCGRRTARWTSSLNRWLLYQTLSLPRSGRASAFYQAGGRVRVPRPAPGRHGARRRPRRELAREHLLRAAVAPVRGGRRPALVALPVGRGRAHARSPTIGSGCPTPHALPRGHRRRGRPRRDACPFSTADRSSREEVERYFAARGLRGERDALRALRPGARPKPRRRRARPAADRAPATGTTA